MEWQDQGTILGVRRHGESSAIIEVFCELHGRHFGLVRGGGSRKAAATLQAGTQIDLVWRAKLEDQLGTFSVEATKSRGTAFIGFREKLYAFNALSSLLSALLPEREPNPRLYEQYLCLLTAMECEAYWPDIYCRFELALLESLGYGIDLSRCAVSGVSADLTHVSPRSGRAVGSAAARGWEQKLLALPDFLLSAEAQNITPQAFLRSLELTGYFLTSRGFANVARLPEARQRLQELVARYVKNGQGFDSNTG